MLMDAIKGFIFGQKKKRSRRPFYDSLCYLVDENCDIFMETYFHEALMQEIRRSERSSKPFFVMLLDLAGFPREVPEKDAIRNAAKALLSSTRDTDIKGWYEYGSVMGVIFAETDVSQQEAIKRKVEDSLASHCGRRQADRIKTSVYAFPSDDKRSLDLDIPGLGLPERNKRGAVAHLIKRGLDIAGSILCLILLSPFFLVIPVLIKLTSRGPVLFRQERFGFRGRPFTFLKFRSMYEDSTEVPHRQYVRDFIRGGEGDSAGENKVYKMRNDPRITCLGKCLRKTSLDEIPQFISVLKGDMSLVGPRPPIPYEVEAYDIWHMRRILDVKPGITGLWQVKGRSATTFDEMVRLDLQYVRTWSLWLDIAILLRTPLVVLMGKGAY